MRTETEGGWQALTPICLALVAIGLGVGLALAASADPRLSGVYGGGTGPGSRFDHNRAAVRYSARCGAGGNGGKPRWPD